MNIRHPKAVNFLIGTDAGSDLIFYRQVSLIHRRNPECCFFTMSEIEILRKVKAYAAYLELS
jgi:hypothetical protein